MDDGKVNVLGPDMQAAINDALDRAEKDSAKAVVLAGNERVFSGGFDLAVFQSGDAKAALGMLAGGFELSLRCLTFPAPVIMAATGSAIAMGSFLLLVGRPPGGSAEDEVPGDRGGHRHDDSDRGDRDHADAPDPCGLPPRRRPGVDLLRRRGDRRRLARRDRGEGDVLAAAQEAAAEAAKLHTGAHVATKLKARDSALKAIRAGIDGLATEFTSRLGR